MEAQQTGFRMHGAIPVYGTEVDAGALQQIERCYALGVECALMADHHKGYGVPIGGVLAHPYLIAPGGVGFDIACGNKAVRLEGVTGDDARRRISDIMDEIVRKVAFGIGRQNNTSIDHALFYGDVWKLDCVAPHKQMAREQLGTVGSGNHFVDVFVDEQDRVWVGVHFGSRGLGHKTATWFLNATGAKDDMDSTPVLLDVESDLGEQYIRAMDLAGQYAYAGRDWVCQVVAGIVGGEIAEEIHNHHNFAWRERHGDEQYWVVRKGATPAFPGQKGFIGGSMAENAVIVEGVDSSQSALNWYSTVHGAGRVMSRTQARGKINRKTREVVSPGKISREMMDEWVNRANVELRGADVDESPFCYKRLPEVLDCHAGTIRVLHTLTPIGVAMAGNDVFDPYKD